MLVWLYLSTVFVSISANPERWLQRSAVLDKDGRFYVQWGTGDKEDIYFKVEVRTLGYVALGFSRDGTMVNSDIVIGWVSDQRMYLQDRYAEDYRMPELDAQQDWELISGSENSTHTVMFFRRKLVTCDPQDFPLEYDNNIRLLYAYSLRDPRNEFAIPYHGRNRRGWKSFLLLHPIIPKEQNVDYWDVLTSDFAVSPEWETKYWCKLFRIPPLSQKHHVTTADVVILDGNKGHYVHHIVLFECYGAEPKDFEPYVGTDGYDCLDLTSPSIVWRCDGVFVAWGRGGDSLVLPEHVGLPLDPNPTKYYMLQVHYDNFKRHKGKPGRAGFRLHYTQALRQFDAGTLMVGADNAPNMMIPPGVRNFVVAGHSNPDCTGPAIPENGVQMTTLGLHTHLIGRQVKLRHYRGNIELPTLAFNKHYDPDQQQFHQLREEITLLPQDQLTLECTYDSTKRRKITFGGYGTQEEMCNAFVIYYPKFEGRYGSMSYATKDTVTQAIGSQELMNLTAGQTEYDRTFVEFMTKYNWKKTPIRRYENLVRMSKHRTFCHLGTGDRTTVRSTISYPDDLQEYIPEPLCPTQVQ